MVVTHPLDTYLLQCEFGPWSLSLRYFFYISSFILHIQFLFSATDWLNPFASLILNHFDCSSKKR